MMYPLTDCVAPEAKYIGANSKSNFKEWQTDAVNEFFNNRDIKTNRIKMKTDYTDVYQCFCRYQEKMEVPRDTFYNKKTTHDGIKSITICSYYYDDVR